MRKREAQALTPGSGRMGAKDTTGIPEHASRGMGLSLGLPRFPDEPEYLIRRAVHIVVGDDMVVARCIAHLRLGDLATRCDVLCALGLALLEPSLQVLHRRWRDKDEKSVRDQLPHLLRTLYVDLQNRVAAGGAKLVHLRRGCGVKVPVVFRALEQQTITLRLFEFFPAGEHVVHTLNLVRTAGSSRRRHALGAVG